MYGASIEKQFSHVAFENEQLRRRMQTRRILESDVQHQERRRRSLVDLFGRIADRIEPRLPARQSPVAQS